MVGIGKAGSSFGGVSGIAKGSLVVILQEVKDAVADVISDKTETSWYGVENMAPFFTFSLLAYFPPHLLTSPHLPTSPLPTPPHLTFLPTPHLPFVAYTQCHNNIHLFCNAYRCVAGYEGGNVKKPISLLGSGTGSGTGIVEDIKVLCPENHVVYAYVRMVCCIYTLYVYTCCI